jgi:hypothetical protein
MKFAAMLATAVVAAGAGAAFPAAADPSDDPNDDSLPEGVPEGTYTYSQPGASEDTWTITPLCVPVVTEGRVPAKHKIGCKLQIDSDSIAGAFRLVNDRWSMTTDRSNGMKCSDGTKSPATLTYEFDNALNGTYSVSHNRVCGMQPGIERQPFTLSYVGPLDSPVIHYPLHCQDNMQHLCS